MAFEKTNSYYSTNVESTIRIATILNSKQIKIIWNFENHSSIISANFSFNWYSVLWKD
jgi:hypothetical protein